MTLGHSLAEGMTVMVEVGKNKPVHLRDEHTPSTLN